MESLKIIALTHKNLSLDLIGKFHISEECLEERLSFVKAQLGLNELMFVSTCNRVEIIIHSKYSLDYSFVREILTHLNDKLNEKDIETALNGVEIFEGLNAITHIFKVASSIDSMVIGEREIITQVRNAYEKSVDLKLSGDNIRLVIRKTIEVAKEIYTKTSISRKPVSVVSLAYHKLLDFNLNLNTKFLIIGAGQTNKTMTRFLYKHGYRNFVVFNRSIENAKKLAHGISGVAYSLSDIIEFKGGFDVIITCTGSIETVVTQDIYKSIIDGDLNQKIIIDLSVPINFDSAIAESYNIKLVTVKELKKTADLNILERSKDLSMCEKIIEKGVAEFSSLRKERNIEIAMQEIPEKVKEIGDLALNSVFAKDIAKLDEESIEVINKVVKYLEKKYISVPFKIAKEILSKENSFRNN